VVIVYTGMGKLQSQNRLTTAHESHTERHIVFREPPVVIEIDIELLRLMAQRSSNEDSMESIFINLDLRFALNHLRHRPPPSNELRTRRELVRSSSTYSSAADLAYTRVRRDSDVCRTARIGEAFNHDSNL